MSQSKCMTCIFLWFGFWLNNICDASMPTFYTYLKLHSQLLVVGKRANSKSLWWDIHTHWAIERIIWGTCLLYKTFQKTSGKMVELGMNDKQNVCESVLSCNRPRPEIANKPHWSWDNNRVDRTCRYVRIAVENLLISLVLWDVIGIVATPDQRTKALLCSGWAKGKLGGSCWWSLSTNLYHQIKIKREGLYIFTHIYLCY